MVSVDSFTYHISFNYDFYENQQPTIVLQYAVFHNPKFLVYRVKLYQSEDLQEDEQSQCRAYTQHYTYRDCVLSKIEEVSLSAKFLGLS